ncbi:hypothetical protein Ssi03_62720 [Sphaerisporangium siamense]|uniref:Phage tail protein n=1 Tax=Sphaerisporangium siamense TaxID=795645 RepID=A0A7W7GBA3_9ACTN|nr:hypothetical protein [Sphaerisporangium siamense]MBB4702580.1 hypothetical protein [Sphaerisporangium siamense]GII88282.1 hypothetical protein Ssi03_62720 [Sphaerisporangium siamense]
MPATPLAAVTRYWSVAVNKWYFVPAISNKSAPTRLELNAGTDLTGEVADSSGWTTTGDTIEAPDGNSVFIAQVAGPVKADDSSLTIYADPTGNDARTLLPRGTTGFVVRLGGGDTAGRKMDVFPIRVKTVGKQYGGTATEPAKLEISFAITSTPAEDVTIP